MININVQIPAPQDNVNPMLPVQPKSLDDPHTLQLPSSAEHPNVQGMDFIDGSDSSEQVEDVTSHEQSLSAGCWNTQQIDCTNGSDSVEQAEDEFLFNSQVSLIVYPPPHVMEYPSVYSFSGSSEVSTHMDAHVHTHTHTHARTHTHTHTHTHTKRCMHVLLVCITGYTRHQ